LTNCLLSQRNKIFFDSIIVSQNNSGEIPGESLTPGRKLTPSEQNTIMWEQIGVLARRVEIPDSSVILAKSMTEQYRTERGSLEGLALEIVATAAIYAASKVTGIARDPTDFAEAAGDAVTRKELLRLSKNLVSTLGLDPVPFLESKQYVDRYVDELDLSERISKRAKHIVSTTENHGVSIGKRPSGWAAAAVYNACLDMNCSVTQKQIGDVANVSVVTIRNRYQEQNKAMRDLESLPENVVDFINVVSTASATRSITSLLAQTLIKKAKKAEYPVADTPTEWALGAIWCACDWLDDSVSIRTLGQYTSSSTADIRKRSAQIRSLMTFAEVADFREKHI